MLRFRANRWWAFVLTLCLFTTCFFLFTAQLPSVASADPGSYFMPDESQPTTPTVGDPDVPMGPGDGRTGKGYVIRSGSQQVAPQTGARPVNYGAVPTNVVTERVRMFLLGLRGLILHF